MHSREAQPQRIRPLAPHLGHRNHFCLQQMTRTTAGLENFVLTKIAPEIRTYLHFDHSKVDLKALGERVECDCWPYLMIPKTREQWQSNAWLVFHGKKQFLTLYTKEFPSLLSGRVAQLVERELCMLEV